MTMWFRVSFEHAIAHAVSFELFEPLVSEMLDREHPIADFEKRYGREQAASLGGNPATIDAWAFDCGGIAHMHEPKIVLMIDELSIDVRVSHFDAVRHEIERSEPRRFANGVMYHKLKFWMHATVLTLSQLRELRRQMLVHAASARQLHDKWRRGNRENEETIARVVARAPRAEDVS